MAELAIPLIALGGMYVISKQENKDNKIREEFTNMGKVGNHNSLYPTLTHSPEVNYPISKDINPDNVMIYENENQTTDRYFNPNIVSGRVEMKNPPNSVGGGIKPVLSLNGEPIVRSEFKHNNMVPFFGGKLRGASTSHNISENILDSKQGLGSQYFSKSEKAPLFKPQDNIHNVFGSSNVSDFIQSRVNPSMRMANVKPFEEERVAPGLNKGFTSEGGVGFNNGMEARETWLPRNVDDLRVLTNPKMTFGLQGHEGPANSYNKESGTTYTQGVVEKNRPDTYYTLGEDRLFTTTGIEKGQTLRSIEELKEVNRMNTNMEYYGINGSKMNEASYSNREYLPSTRVVLDTNPVINHTNALSKGNYHATDGDYGNKGYNILPNNRSTTKHHESEEYGVVQGMMKAMFAPIMDIMKPSRKENVIENIRVNGDAGATVSNMPIFNPSDRVRTTIKEMTGDKLDNNHLNMERQFGAAYIVSEQQPVQMQRDTTTNIHYNGNAGPTVQTGPTTYDAAYRQRNNVNKTYENRPNQGGTQMFNQNENISIQRLDSDRNNNRMWVKNGGIYTPPTMDTHGKLSGNMNLKSVDSHNFERINPDILTAFKSNPYTQSLQSWA
jgi:hypothetical protein